MRPEIISPFVNATHATFHQVLAHVAFEWGEPEITSIALQSDNIASAIQLNGDMNGQLLLVMTKDTAVNLASAMNGSTLTGINSLVLASINELANMVAGKAVSYLREKGIALDIFPPQQVDQLEMLSGRNFLSIPVTSPFGPVTVCIVLQG